MGANISQNKAQSANQVGYFNPNNCPSGETCGSGTIKQVKYRGKTFNGLMCNGNYCYEVTGSKTTYSNGTATGTASAPQGRTLFSNSEDATVHAHLKMPNGIIVTLVIEKVKGSRVAQFTATLPYMSKGRVTLYTFVGTIQGNKFQYRSANAN